ncbi:MAG: hypothetical protein HZA78_04440 [Candidatus Schekmanbacteria bacterium]|nr:hypothetical protein [Candidatus Schekmanbacteria bacterium]
MKKVLEEYSVEGNKPSYTKPRIVISYTKETLKEEFKELKGATVKFDLF